MKTWQARYIYSFYVRAETAEEARRDIQMAERGLKAESQDIGDVLGFQLLAEVSQQIDFVEVTDDDDPFPNEDDDEDPVEVGGRPGA